MHAALLELVYLYDYTVMQESLCVFPAIQGPPCSTEAGRFEPGRRSQAAGG